MSVIEVVGTLLEGEVVAAPADVPDPNAAAAGTLAGLRARCRGDYTGIYTDEEDGRFTNAQLNQWINDAHREMAEFAKLYRTTKVLDVAVGADGVSYAALPADVFSVIPGTVRAWDGSQYQDLEYRDEDSLLREYGPLDGVTNGSPRYYYLRAGAELGQQLLLVLYPGSDTVRLNGLRVGCYLHPALLTDAANTSTPAFPPAQHQFLVAVVRAKMADAELAQGRADAPVAVMTAKAQEARENLRIATQEARRVGTRRIHYVEECW